MTSFFHSEFITEEFISLSSEKVTNHTLDSILEICINRLCEALDVPIHSSNFTDADLIPILQKSVKRSYQSLKNLTQNNNNDCSSGSSSDSNSTIVSVTLNELWNDYSHIILTITNSNSSNSTSSSSGDDNDGGGGVMVLVSLLLQEIESGSSGVMMMIRGILLAYSGIGSSGSGSGGSVKLCDYITILIQLTSRSLSYIYSGGGGGDGGDDSGSSDMILHCIYLMIVLTTSSSSSSDDDGGGGSDVLVECYRLLLFPLLRLVIVIIGSSGGGIGSGNIELFSKLRKLSIPTTSSGGSGSGSGGSGSGGSVIVLLFEKLLSLPLKTITTTATTTTATTATTDTFILPLLHLPLLVLQVVVYRVVVIECEDIINYISGSGGSSDVISEALKWCGYSNILHLYTPLYHYHHTTTTTLHTILTPPLPLPLMVRPLPRHQILAETIISAMYGITNPNPNGSSSSSSTGNGSSGNNISSSSSSGSSSGSISGSDSSSTGALLQVVKAKNLLLVEPSSSSGDGGASGVSIGSGGSGDTDGNDITLTPHQSNNLLDTTTSTTTTLQQPLSLLSPLKSSSIESLLNTMNFSINPNPKLNLSGSSSSGSIGGGGDGSDDSNMILPVLPFDITSPTSTTKSNKVALELFELSSIINWLNNNRSGSVVSSVVYYNIINTIPTAVNIINWLCSSSSSSGGGGGVSGSGAGSSGGRLIQYKLPTTTPFGSDVYYIGYNERWCVCGTSLSNNNKYNSGSNYYNNNNNNNNTTPGYHNHTTTTTTTTTTGTTRSIPSIEGRASLSPKTLKEIGNSNTGNGSGSGSGDCKYDNEVSGFTNADIILLETLESSICKLELLLANSSRVRNSDSGSSRVSGSVQICINLIMKLFTYCIRELESSESSNSSSGGGGSGGVINVIHPITLQRTLLDSSLVIELTSLMVMVVEVWCTCNINDYIMGCICNTVVPHIDLSITDSSSIGGGIGISSNSNSGSSNTSITTSNYYIDSINKILYINSLYSRLRLSPQLQQSMVIKVNLCGLRHVSSGSSSSSRDYDEFEVYASVRLTRLNQAHAAAVGKCMCVYVYVCVLWRLFYNDNSQNLIKHILLLQLE